MIKTLKSIKKTYCSAFPTKNRLTMLIKLEGRQAAESKEEKDRIKIQNKSSGGEVEREMGRLK